MFNAFSWSNEVFAASFQRKKESRELFIIYPFAKRIWNNYTNRTCSLFVVSHGRKHLRKLVENGIKIYWKENRQTKWRSNWQSWSRYNDGDRLKILPSINIIIMKASWVMFLNNFFNDQKKSSRHGTKPWCDNMVVGEILLWSMIKYISVRRYQTHCIWATLLKSCNDLTFFNGCINSRSEI